jgi:hypothetical protein
VGVFPLTYTTQIMRKVLKKHPHTRPAPPLAMNINVFYTISGSYTINTHLLKTDVQKTIIYIENFLNTFPTNKASFDGFKKTETNIFENKSKHPQNNVNFPFSSFPHRLRGSSNTPRYTHTYGYRRKEAIFMKT